jgi:hypothetical protein
LGDKVLIVVSTGGAAKSAVILVHGTVDQPLAWPTYAPIKRTDATFLTSLDSKRFVVTESASVSSAPDLARMSLRALPVCPGLRLTTSKAGMVRPRQMSLNGRRQPVIATPVRKLFSPVVKRGLFTFDPE